MWTIHLSPQLIAHAATCSPLMANTSAVDDVDRACKLLQERVPDVIVFRAPPGTASRVAKLRTLAPACAIIVLTDRYVPAHTLSFIEAGAQDVIGQEDWPNDLDCVIRRAIPRARAQARMWDSHERLRATFEAMPSGVLVTSVDGVVLDANAAALAHLCLDAPHQLIGRLLSDVVPAAGPLVHERADRFSLKLALPQGQSRLLGFTTSETPSRRTRVTVFRDVTEVKAAEERRKRAEQLAQVGEVAARLGHEIKNPLTSALVGLQLVESAPELPPILRDIVQASLQELRSAARIITELLSAARASSLTPQIVAIPALVYAAIDPYRGFASRKGVTLSVHEPEDPEVWAVADPSWLHRAVTNLLVNAVEACSRGGLVDVTVRVVDRSTVQQRFPDCQGVVGIRVTDNGVGIPAREFDEIFKPFHTTKNGGTGLGLAVVLDVVEAHGAVLEVVSTVGQTTSFEILLPLVDPLADESTADCVSACGSRPKGIAHGCWMALGYDDFVRTGQWPAECRNCSIFKSTNLRSAAPHRSPTTSRED